MMKIGFIFVRKKKKKNEAGYYLKTRVPIVRLFSCLPETNKGMDEGFLIVLGEWQMDCTARPKMAH